jgi:hypothetical protein
MPDDTLAARFESVEGSVSTLANGYTSLTRALNNAGGHNASGES